MIKVRIFLRTLSDSDLLLIFVSRNLTVTQVYAASMPFCKSSHIYCNPTTIHAPRVGSDLFFSVSLFNYFYFNPRSPCGERRKILSEFCCLCRFQSTLPVWGATALLVFPSRPVKNFNPRSPCGERRHRVTITDKQVTISIHAPRVGSDTLCPNQAERAKISIHAPRVGSDCRNAE